MGITIYFVRLSSLITTLINSIQFIVYLLYHHICYGIMETMNKYLTAFIIELKPFIKIYLIITH